MMSPVRVSMRRPPAARDPADAVERRRAPAAQAAIPAAAHRDARARGHALARIEVMPAQRSAAPGTGDMRPKGGGPALPGGVRLTYQRASGADLSGPPRRRREVTAHAFRGPERVGELAGLETRADNRPQVRQLRALRTSLNAPVVQLLPDEDRQRLRQAIIGLLEKYRVPFDETRVLQILNAVDPPPREVRISAFSDPEEKFAIIDRGAASLRDAIFRAELTVLRMAVLRRPPLLEEEQLAPAAVTTSTGPRGTAAIAEAESTRSTTTTGRTTRPEQARFRRNPKRTEEALRRAASRPRVEDPQERRERERRERGDAIVGNLANATITPVGGRWNAHLTDHGGDGSAEINWNTAQRLIRDGRNVRFQREDQPGNPVYSITYKEGLRIVFSTPDDGLTVHVFHIGPGAAQ